MNKRKENDVKDSGWLQGGRTAALSRNVKVALSEEMALEGDLKEEEEPDTRGWRKHSRQKEQ